MTETKLGNKCSRCGKQRVITKTYKEKVGNGYVFYTETSCPDPECQSKVNKDNQNENKKRAKIQDEQEKREQERKVKMANRKKDRE